MTRESKSTHDDALRLIAEKEEEIEELKMGLFEKEELIKINYEELRDYQRDYKVAVEENKSLKFDIKHLQQELAAVSQQAMEF